ncbi:Bifunctional transcriptional activator/DNA repair enzyme Ada [Pandoraea terrae]|uniref:methylated-DNA--[protein]-cysteine S-methyltransferase n=1 Tax=Pandoraea terrae TaxID=1537710 RepID=A0A5E4V607_9BURK|nr:bifunctional DNA-binding transcriptional regulator/O6-methylguanine-DNA methyltransferase Ada [Pandoraea terrae]VVE07511.1 Bifunctional transcriptional activator/DNA repair enzyme Ada [Pandoraea terrae]
MSLSQPTSRRRESAPDSTAPRTGNAAPNAKRKPRYTTDAARWAAVIARDKAADGRFYYAVRTTGVYCRPSCGARLALRENVSFHDSREAAEHAGFRPCKRCKPDKAGLAAEHAARIAAACRRIESADAMPSLEMLASEAGLSTYHFHRLFKSVTGLTPRAYANARRGERVRSTLPIASSVTEALYDAGFNSNGRFYAAAGDMLGMKPAVFRDGGANEVIRFAVAQCALGALLVAATPRGLCAISLGDDPDALVREFQDRFPQAQLIGADAKFERWVAQVIGFVETPRIGLGLPLDVRGTAFQQRVWQALRDIPPGQTASYSDVAERIGSPRSVRAVAMACAANTLAVAIPCHRVVRQNGDVSGYRWGVAKKRALLAREASEGARTPGASTGDVNA